ncbi:MAG: DUF4350 domain-containing protein [Desulfuromonadales bacterium]|nr:DUF4350 domain-containing protein [Desulfuromonadales bacterium]NIR33502.1 DUF4350 domain-containing protein [Desulfuromonadales bacterium]NIS43533.1 DUF4350 domain-containing protein [Desulfuromonadales bacterium]
MTKMRRGVAVLVVSVCLWALGGPAAAATVLFDQGHGQMFTIDKDEPLHLARLAGVFRQAGAEVQALSTSIDAEALAGIDVLVSSGPFRPFSPPEIAALEEFVEGGGRFVLMLHIAPPARGVLDRLGLAYSNGVVRERENVIGGNPLDFFVDDLATHPVTEGLETFALYGSWALRPRDERTAPLARTSGRSWVDLDGDKKLGDADAVQAFVVAAHGSRGKGAFVVFADDAVFQNRFLEAQNLELAKNLARWALTDE